MSRRGPESVPTPRPSDRRRRSARLSPRLDRPPERRELPVFQAPADYVPRLHSDELRHEVREPRIDLVAAAGMELGFAAYLHGPSPLRIGIVHEHRDAPVLLDVPPFLAVREVHAADVDRVFGFVVVERHRHDMRLTVGAYRREATHRLAAEVVDLLLREHTH